MKREKSVSKRYFLPFPNEGRLGWVLPRKGNMKNKISTHLNHLSQNVTFSHLLFGRVSQGGIEVYMSLRGAKRRSNPIYIYNFNFLS